MSPRLAKELAKGQFLKSRPGNSSGTVCYRRQRHGWIAGAYIKARNKFIDDDEPIPQQYKHIFKQCDLVLGMLATVGIAALVDEATGFQYVRDKLALQEILDKYLRKEFATWAKSFPDEFYREIFRLRNWVWKGMKINRPQCVAKYTMDLVYSRLTKDLVKELETRNPIVNGKRKAKHYWWLTEDIGHPALAQHLHAVIGLMRASEGWDQFKKLIDRSFPVRDDSGQTKMDFDSSIES